MSERVIILGAGGHGKVVADIVLRSSDTLLGFLDDGTEGAVCGFPVLGKITDYQKFPDAAFVIAVGNSAAREQIARQLHGVRWYTAVHPAAVVSPLDVQLGAGTVVMANAVINPSARVGKHCIVNTAAVVEHDDCIGDFSHLAVGARLGGTVAIGKHTWVGLGASVSNNVSVCGHCLIGAGAVVIHNIEESGTYVGVPARKIK